MRPAFLLSVALLVGCPGERHLDESFDEAPVSAAPVEWSEDPELDGFRFELSEDSPQGAGVEQLPRADATDLPEQATRGLLARAPDLEGQAGDQEAFALREGTQPPPRTGETVDVPFPPPDTSDAPEADTGPLQVLRFAPEGEVPMAPHLSVTFSQPMVPVTSQDAAAEVRPVDIEPLPEGTWRWIGSKTVLFEPSAYDRFPMATTYTVRVPAGTASETGGTLDEPTEWSFTTPPPSLQSVWPSDGRPHERDPLIFLGFDQRIDADAMAEHVSLRAAKGPRTWELTGASAAAIERDDRVRRLVEQAEPERYVVLAPAETLPAATRFEIVVEEGAPSAEGPDPTEQDQVRAFATYDPLEVVDQHCYRARKGCYPGGQWTIEFNNPLDEGAFDEGSLVVEPTPDRVSAFAQGRHLRIQVDAEAHTTYEVTLPAELSDRFGQELGAEQPVAFDVGGLDPSFQGPGRDLLVLDPSAPPVYPVFTVNHQQMRVRVYRASPDDYAAVSEWFRSWRHDGRMQGAPPLQELADQRIEVADYAEDERIETPIDLSGYLEGETGQLFVWVEPVPQPKNRWEQTHLLSWVQVTDLGLSAFVDQDEILGWASRLSDGAPLEGVELTVRGGQGAVEPVSTDSQGLARLPKLDDAAGPHLLVARQGDDVAILPDRQGWWNERGSWVRSTPGTGLLWYAFDDRHMYRPGETVSVKGWIRSFDRGPGGDVSLPDPQPREVTWIAQDASGNEMTRGTSEVSETGGFHLGFELPDTPALGRATLRLRVDAAASGDQHYHSFQIQEFRRPEFEVSASADPGPWVLGEHATVEVSAQYFAGGALPGAPVRWHVRSSPATYQPPGWADYRFGPWTPWWGFGRGIGIPGQSPGESKSLEGRTDAAGSHLVGIDFLAVNPPRPWTVSAEATVTDVNRQRWTASQDLLVHPSAAYVGVRTERPFVQKGQPLDVDLVLVDIDGEPVAGREVDVSLARLEWRYEQGEWKERELEPATCTATSTAEAVSCSFQPDEGGSYVLRATATDAEGRPNQTELRVWVSGGSGKPSRGVEMQEITLVPDQESYAPGDVAEVLVVAPFHPAEGLWTLRRNGLVHSERFTLDEPTATLEIPITDAHLPNVHLGVDLVGTTERLDDAGEPVPDAPPQVAQASGELDLQVPPHERALAVEITPREAELSPGGSTVLDLVVRDADEQPVAAEVAVVAVDEAVLSLSGYEVPDPLEVFYRSQGAGVSEEHLRSLVQLASKSVITSTGGGASGGARGAADGAMEMQAAGAPRMRAMKAGAPAEADMAMADEPAPSGPSIELREDFSATALFAPRVTTGDDGTGQVELDLPDSLTRYRVFAVAVHGGEQFGTSEATVTARLPVMLRPSPPRFLNFGDRAELPLVIQNQTDSERTVQVALESVNARVIDTVASAPAGPAVRIAGRELSVPPRNRVEVRIPVATESAGTARFQAVIASGDHADATRFDLPVWTPATSEAFATYGTVDDEMVVQPVRAPDDVWVQFGGLDVNTSSTQLQALTDAVLYLVQYPFECNEQIASRVLAVAGLRDVLSAFEAEGMPAPEELEAAVARDLERLQRRQHRHGGFSFWRHDDRAWPYPSVHVAHALVRAEAEGLQVPGQMLDRSRSYLRDIEQHIPGWYSQEAKWAIRAYALYVRHRMGDSDAGKARALLAEAGVDALPLEAQGWILPTLHASGRSGDVDAILRHLGNQVAETAGAAHFTTGYSDGEYVLLHSSRRADGVLLEALITVHGDDDEDLVPKLVQGLLAHRTKGRWTNTQENAFVLLAMDAYFEAYEAQTPDFVARVWLGDQFAGEHAFEGRTTETAHVGIPMGYLTDPGGTQDLVIAKDGPGRLYYRIGMRYAPKDLTYEPADHGFTVLREYDAIDDPDDVWQDTDGTWHVRAGARVRGRVTMVAPARRYHVALTDPLPAGLEAQNPALAVTGTLPEDPQSQQGGHWWWRGTWYQHQNLRDERVEAYTSLLWDGVYTYSWVGVATTPGEYVVPPAKAEEMYAPETFGRSGSDRVVVE